jgi:hypothetical protein
MGFYDELKALLNKHSRENESNTPDYVLADFIVASLAAFDSAINTRELMTTKSETDRGSFGSFVK